MSAQRPEPPHASQPGKARGGLLPTATTKESAKLGLRLLWKQKWLLISSIALLLIGTSTMLLIPPLLGAIVDAVIAGKDFSTVLWLGGGLAVAGGVAAALEGFGGVLLVRCLQRALAELREDVFAAALSLPLARVEDAGDADVISRVTNDVEAVTEAISGVIPMTVRALFTIVLTVIGMAALDPWLALAALAAVPVQVVSLTVFMRRSRPLYARLRTEEAERGREFVEAIAGADTVRAYGVQETHLTKIADASARAVETQRETGRARNVFNGGLNGAELVGLAAVLAVGFVRVTTAGLSVGAVTAGALYFHRLFGPIGELLYSMDELQRALAGVQRLAGVVLYVPAGDDVHDREAEIADGAVRIREVRYRYSPDAPREALQGVSLNAPEGSTVALIGRSGSGKSTLARLIVGFDTPVSGAVEVGGVPAERALRGGKPAALLVAQETHLFVGSIADNMRIADPAATDDEIRAALLAVRFDIDAVDGGLAGELTSAVSHREVQQLALARVLLADPAVVVLDEAGSQAGADPTLADAMREVARSRTAIVIAHHLDQVRDADTMVVFEDGRVVEAGSPDVLLATEGSAFAELWRLSHGGE